VKTPEDVAKVDRRLRQLLFLDLLDDGFYLAERGFMALSLKITDEDCGRLVTAVEGFVSRRKDVLAA
jgi:glutamate-1-semialdehyde 2,1-aminomutase